MDWIGKNYESWLPRRGRAAFTGVVQGIWLDDRLCLEYADREVVWLAALLEANKKEWTARRRCHSTAGWRPARCRDMPRCGSRFSYSGLRTTNPKSGPNTSYGGNRVDEPHPGSVDGIVEPPIGRQRVQAGDDGWIGADGYTTKYSAVIRLARLMVIHKACILRREAIKRYQRRGLSIAETEAEAPSHYHLIRQSVVQFMTMAHNGCKSTPMQWLYRRRWYRFKIRYTTTAEGKIQWIGDDVLPRDAVLARPSSGDGARVSRRGTRGVVQAVDGGADGRGSGRGYRSRCRRPSTGAGWSISRPRPGLDGRF